MKIARFILFGLLIWIIPFVIGFLFYDANGNLATDIFLFKSVMIVVLVATCTVLSIIHWKKATLTGSAAFIVSAIWLVIPLILDFLVLVPMAEMSSGDYIQQIGLRYLVIPIIVLSHGKLLKIHAQPESSPN